MTWFLNLSVFNKLLYTGSAIIALLAILVCVIVYVHSITYTYYSAKKQALEKESGVNKEKHHG